MTDESTADRDLNESVLDRYLAGVASADERARVAAWCAGRPDRAAMLGEFGSVLPGAYHSNGTPVDVEDAIRRLTLRRADGDRMIMTMPDGRRGVSSRPTRTWGWAAGLAVAAATVAVAVVRWHNVGTAATVLPVRSYSTAVGQTAVLTLDDGSRVTIAPRTTLRLEPGFGEQVRVVQLTGEAYFDVRRSAGAPFVVRTGAVTTRVLGTAFDVRRYSGDAATHVAVVTGRVAVIAGMRRSPPATLAAGDVAVATDSSVATAPAGGTAPYTAWVDGVLVFHEAPVGEVLASLSRWYGYEFRLADPAIASQKLTVGVSTTSSREALATLKLALGVELRFDGTVVTLSPRREARPGNAVPRVQRGRDPISSPDTREVGR